MRSWQLVEHTSATEPIPLVVLEAKASQHRQARRLRHSDHSQSALTISKTGQLLIDDTDVIGPGSDQSIVEVTRDNRQVYYQGFHVSLPSTFAGREFYRTITDEEFLLNDPTTGEVAFSFPLPMVALQVRGRYVASYAIRGVQMSYPSKHWQRKFAEHQQEFIQREQLLPAVFTAENPPRSLYTKS